MSALNTIRVRLLLAMAGVTLLAGLVIGLSAAGISGAAVEKRATADAARNAAQLISRLHLPLSPQLMAQVGAMYGGDAVAVAANGHVIATNMAATELAPISASLAEFPPGVHHADSSSHIVSVALLKNGLDASAAEARLYLLMPRKRVLAAQREAMAPILGITALILAASLGLGIWLSRTMSRPVGVLAARMTDMAEQVRDNAAWPVPDSLVATVKLAPRTPKKVQDLQRAFMGLLTELGDARTRMAEAARLAAVGQLAASIAHEVRNPLSGIKMNAKILADEFAAKGHSDESLNLIVREIDRLDVYLEELLSIAAGSAVPAGEPTGTDAHSIASILSSLAVLLAARAEKQHTLITTVIENEDSVVGNPRYVRQILLNMLLNALDAVRGLDEGKIDICASRREDTVRISVQDNGPGVDHSAGDVFAPFVSTKRSGAGLGLAVSRRLARACHGDIGFEKTPLGARFHLDLPLVDQEASAR